MIARLLPTLHRRAPRPGALTRCAKLALVLVLAVAATATMTRTATLDGRAARLALARDAAHRQATQVGVATLGTAYLETTDPAQRDFKPEPTNPLNSSILETLDRGLDPMNSEGGLYPIRKGMEQLASMLMFPLLIIGIFHALVTGKGAADQKLVQVGVRFFTVVTLLWAYPAWDNLLYQRIAKKLATQLQNGEMVHEIVDNIGGASIAQGVGNGGASTLDVIAGFNEAKLKCPVEAVRADNPQEVDQVCKTRRGTKLEQVLMMRNADGMLLGKPEEKVAYWDNRYPQSVEAAEIAYAQGRGAGSADGESSDVGVFRGLWNDTKRAFGSTEAGPGVMDVIGGHIGKYLETTVAGVLTSLEAILATVALWFVWLGVIVTRAFSLALAPIALVWGLVPNSESKAFNWFKGHAKIVFKPVGLSFGLLIFFALQVAVFTTPMTGHAVIGLGIKFALFVGLCATMFKSSTMMNFMAGDVTKVAEDIGTATRNKTIQMVGAAGTMVATGGAGLALKTSSLAAKGGTVGKVAAKALNIGGQMGKTANSMAEKFGIKSKTPGEKTFLQKGASALKDSALVAGAVAKKGFEMSAKGANPDATLGQAAKAGFVDQFKGAKEDIRKMRKDRAERTVTAPEKETERALNEGKAARSHQRDIKDRYGLSDSEVKLRPGEQLKADLSLAADSRTGKTADALADYLAKAFQQLDINQFRVKPVTKDGVTTLQMDGSATAALQRAAATDERIANLFNELALATYGEKANVPTKQGADGRSMIDVEQLLHRNTDFADAVSQTSQIMTAVSDEGLFRAAAAKAAKAKGNSVFESAVRETHQEVRAPLQDETIEDHGHRMAAEGDRVLRMTWYLAADDAAREKALGKDHSVDKAADHLGDSYILEWKGEQSMDKVSQNPKLLNSFRQATEMRADYFSSMAERRAVQGGEDFGLDMDTLIRSGGTEKKYRGADGSLYETLATNNPSIDPEKLYLMAMDEVFTNPAYQSVVRDYDSAKETRAEYIRRAGAKINEAVFLSNPPA